MEQEAKQSGLDDIVVIDETNIPESEIEDDPQILDEVDNSITTTHRIDAGSEKREKTSSPGRLKTKARP